LPAAPAPAAEEAQLLSLRLNIFETKLWNASTFVLAFYEQQFD